MKIKEYLSFTEKGIRDKNEDSFYPKQESFIKDGKIFMVCDGMGGHKGGEIASGIVCKNISDYLNIHCNDGNYEQHFKDAIESTQSLIDAYITEHNESAGMGTTLAMLYFTDNGAYSVHIGDSRVYHIRNGKTLWVTWDHSKVNELIKAGIITKVQAKQSNRNIILRALQGNLIHKIEADITFIDNICTDDYFLICSDGVWECFEDDDIGFFLSDDKSNILKLENIKDVCEKNSKDNYTACLLQVANDDVPKRIPTKSKKKIITFIFILVCLITTVGIWYQYVQKITDTKSATSKTQILEDSLKVWRNFNDIDYIKPRKDILKSNTDSLTGFEKIFSIFIPLSQKQKKTINEY